MIEAPIPTNEPERLAALRETQLLDTPLEERFERITRLVCRLLHVPAAQITLVDEARQWFKSVQGSTLTQTLRKHAFCAHAILTDEPMVIPDARQDIRFADNPLVTGPEQVIFYAGCPLKSPDGHHIGVLCAVDHHPRHFSAEDLQTLRDLASLAQDELNAATQLNNRHELFSQLDAERRRFLMDPLTRLWNRQGIMAILHRELARARRQGESLGLLLLDIDYFQHINDDYGRPIGDIALRTLSRRLLSSFREYDSIGRIGDDEFLVVLPIRPGKSHVESIANRICHQVRDGGIPSTAGTLLLSVSIGGVDVNPDGAESVEDLVRHANEALHRAKRLGRDRAEVHPMAASTLST